MSLDYDLTNIENHEERCFFTATNDQRDQGVTAGDRVMRPLTERIIFATMIVGIGDLSPSNAPEFAARLDVYQRLFGALLRESVNDEIVDRPVTASDVYFHIGLKTNVFPVESRTAWLRRTAAAELERIARKIKREGVGSQGVALATAAR